MLVFSLNALCFANLLVTSFLYWIPRRPSAKIDLEVLNRSMILCSEPKDDRRADSEEERYPHHSSRAFLLCLAAASLFLFIPATVTADPPWETVDDIICRAQSGVGFSYWWGGECWCRNGCSPDTSCGLGSCSGSCPDCSHSGNYGADCSGYVSRVWQVPYAMAVDACHTDRYVASSFNSSGPHWDQISRSNTERGDALASTSHIVLYESGDPWGNMWAYEARGCSYGIVHNIRSCSSSYNAARRHNINACECTEGDTENRTCGNCGTETRTCGANCLWSDWSDCTGEGQCSAGTEETQNCGDCGTQTRTCTQSCTWEDWTACAGPDPGGGEESCETGLAGECAEGVLLCTDGFLICTPIANSSGEICDGLDNNCNGEIDEGFPTTMGSPPPQYAAELTGADGPAQMEQGKAGEVWMIFVNVGTEPWRGGEVRLITPEVEDNDSSIFYHQESWQGPQVAASLQHEVPPGAAWEITLSVSPNQSAWGAVEETFRLQAPTGELMACPVPLWTFQTEITGDNPPEDGGTPTGPGTNMGDVSYRGACTCRAAQGNGTNRSPSPTSPLYILSLLALSLLFFKLTHSRTL